MRPKVNRVKGNEIIKIIIIQEIKLKELKIKNEIVTKMNA